MLANTYRLSRDVSGFVFEDIWYQNGNNRAAVWMEKKGDEIDLNRVNLEAFAKSVVKGQVQEFFLKGVLLSFQVDVSEKIADSLKNLIEKNTTGFVDRRPAVFVPVQIEPGITVVTGVGGSEPANEKMTIDPGPVYPKAQTAVEIEPGITVPAEEQPQEKTSTEAPGDIVVPDINVDEPESEWKKSLTFEQQKRKIVESTEKEFLTSVIEDSLEGKQFKNLARARLNELS